MKYFLIQNLLKLASQFFIQKGVEAKLFDPVLWNFAVKNRRLYAFRQFQSENLKTNISCSIMVSFDAVVNDGRVIPSKNRFFITVLVIKKTCPWRRVLVVNLVRLILYFNCFVLIFERLLYASYACDFLFFSGWTNDTDDSRPMGLLNLPSILRGLSKLRLF